jgi:hypothetical protein
MNNEMTEDNDFKELEKDIKEEILYANKNFFFEVPEGFLEWFTENGKLFLNIHSVIPDEINVDKTKAGNCFHNSQLISLNNEDASYYEGIIRGVKSTSSTHHGFNLVDERILDVTTLKNAECFLEELSDENYYYFGVKIENDLIEENPDVRTANYLDNPLILKYYLKNKTA